MDYLIKMLKYNTAGVKEYWIVDAAKNRIMAYDFVGDNIEEYSFTDAVPCTVFDGFQIDFGKITIE